MHAANAWREMFCKNGGNTTALWRTTVRLVVLPVFDVSRLKHVADKGKELSILNALLSQVHEDIMVNVIAVAFHVDIDKPCSSRPASLH